MEGIVRDEELTGDVIPDDQACRHIRMKSFIAYRRDLQDRPS